MNRGVVMVGLDFEKVTIVGTGLLGGSVGLALRRAGFKGKIVGTGPRMATLDRAVELRCIDQATLDTAAAVRDSDLILLAAPVGKIPPLLEVLAGCVDRSAVITDVGSTKQSIVAAAESKLKAAGRFVGSHPMAGAETTGPQSARADLFDGKPVILTPTDVTEADAIHRVESLWIALGMRVHRMTPAEHDRLVAVISHVPHAASVLLVDLAGRSGALPVASTGFADTTRLAAGDPELWADIFLDNREAVGAALEQWAAMQADFSRVLQTADRPALLKMLRDAQATRQQWRDRPKGV